MERSSGSVTAYAGSRAPARDTRWTSFVSSCIVAATLVAGSIAAQSSTGSLRGIVTDESKEALAGALVTLVDRTTGFTRTSVSTANGAYVFHALPPGSYSVKAELAGFGTVMVDLVSVTVAARRDLDFALFVTDVEEQVTVTIDSPLIDKVAVPGLFITAAELEGLPAGSRELSCFASLASGTELRANGGSPLPGGTSLGLNGGSGRSVLVVVDGGDNVHPVQGGEAWSQQPETVRELRIETLQFDAEYGRSYGGVMSVVTKSGADELMGSVRGYVRDSTLSGSTTAERQTDTQVEGEGRTEYAVSLGGPITRGRTHFFLAYDKVESDDDYVVQGGVDASLDGAAHPLSSDGETAIAKVTAEISPRQFGVFRYGYQKNAGWQGASSLAAPDSLTRVSNTRESLLATHTWELGSWGASQSSLHYDELDDSATGNSGAPSIVYPGGFHSGRSTDVSRSTRVRRYQFKDDVSWSRGFGSSRHDFKAGVSYSDMTSMRAIIATGLAGEFAAVEDRAASPVSDINYYVDGPATETPVTEYGVYVQDEWSASDRLTVRVGLRYDYADGFDLDQRENAIWQLLSTQSEFGESYLEDFRGGRADVLENDSDNWGPRVGFVFDVTGAANSFVRGGWGIYHDPARTGSTILYPAAAARGNWGVAYHHQSPHGIQNPDGSWYQPGQPLPPNQLFLDGRDFLPNDVASPTLATPKSTQASLGYVTEIDGLIGVTVDLVSIRYRDLPYRFRANPRLDARGGAIERRRFEGFGDFRIWMGDGEADYEAVNLGVRARLANTFDLQGFYTWSRTEGNILAGADGDRLSDVEFQPDWRTALDAPVDPLDPHCDACYGPLDTDARHRATLAVIFRAMRDVTVSGVLRYRSALPYTRLAGSDLDGDGFASDLAPGVDHVNDARGDSFSQMDIRLAKLFRIGEDYGIEIIGEVFNLFDADNPASFDRNGNPNAYAGDPIQGDQRLLQLGARLTF